jgi:magnesium-transporting ATPase (P-type)
VYLTSTEAAPRTLWNQSLAELQKKQAATAALGLTEDFIGPNEMNRMSETLWGKKGGGSITDTEKSERIRLYLLHCALSNTITPEPKTEADGKTSLVFQFTSPDELAICRFAQSMGYELTQRTKEAVKLRVSRRGFGNNSAPAEQEHVFKQLALLDFNPKRKRVTVIYQEGNRVLVMCKGQDSRVVPLIHSDNDDERKAISYLQEQLVIIFQFSTMFFCCVI